MTPENLPAAAASVNQHYLNKVMDLSDEMEVEVTEDVYDARGMKMVSKGAKISRNMQEKLILHKLRKPLESCITVSDGVSVNAVLEEAHRIIQTVEPMHYILKAADGGGPSPLDILAHIHVGKAMRMMLTITDRGGPSALNHSVLVSLLSICLAKKLGLSEKDQTTAALAGLFHDIGELYIEPSYLRSGKRLLPHEWQHVVVHPRIGQLLITELENYPPAVALAVAEHHERFDGAGYPRRLAGKSISTCGQVLSVAEMISGLLKQSDHPLKRAEMALKIIPYEHAHPLISLVSNSLHMSQEARIAVSDNMPSDDANERAKILFDHISVMVETGNKMQDLPTVNSSPAKDLLSQTVKRISTIQRAFLSTGLDMCVNEDIAQSGDILFESIVATKEIQWRLRDVARDLALHSSAFTSAESEAFNPLIAMLDAEPGRKFLMRSATKNGTTEHDEATTNLLLVDDEENVLAALIRALHPLGYTIFKANSGEEALEIMAKNDIGVILSDHRMPGMTGIELLSRVKTMYPNTVRLVLSGHADAATITDAITLGAIYKFLNKPWDLGELNTVLARAFEIYQRDRQLNLIAGTG